MRQGLKGVFLRARAPEPTIRSALAARPLRQKHIWQSGMSEHRQDDWLTAIGGPRGVRAHLQEGPPVGQPEVPQAEMLLQLDRVLPAGLIAECVVGKRG